MIASTTLGDRIMQFHQKLSYTGPLPTGIRIMNPFRESKETLPILQQFCDQYYDDNRPRKLLLGINPGRQGGGITGIPFTDTKRLQSELGIPYSGKQSHEPSSEFIYEMIDAFGGPSAFYHAVYINSPCPLGFVSQREDGSEVNYNYYDSAVLQEMVKPFMVKSVRKLIALGMQTDIVYCMGTGKNEKALLALNKEYKFFNKLIALEHPRFIMQYKRKFLADYIQKYVDALGA
ncbi:MAG TPA: DUF4918 family protein [Flavihumibacter sp.]|nr:DUF4918 family protein [Flavihumibacter sp.]